eukprot:scaffold647942_cov30-Prasinocladus_malaysianus.AAC.1
MFAFAGDISLSSHHRGGVGILAHQVRRLCLSNLRGVTLVCCCGLCGLLGWTACGERAGPGVPCPQEAGGQVL